MTKHLLRIECAHPGCNEARVMACGNAASYRTQQAHYERNPWKCPKRSGRSVLAINTPLELVRSYVVGLNASGGNEWEGQHSGCISGDGWQAYAADWPVGTKVTIRTTIEVERQAQG